jgi:hypothetical protein
MTDEQHDRPPSTRAGASAPDAGASEDESLGGDSPCWAHLFGEDPGLAAKDLNDPLSPEPSDGPERELHHA